MKIRGNTVGTTMKRPDFNQTDPKKSDYILNNPIPPITPEDEDKVLKVVDGKLVFAEGGVDTSDATATAAHILEGETAYVGEGKVVGEISTYDGSFEGGVEINGEDVSLYSGSYSVEPSTEEDITLSTAQTMLNDNITVEKISYAEVSNNSGGTTATIGN